MITYLFIPQTALSDVLTSKQIMFNVELTTACKEAFFITLNLVSILFHFRPWYFFSFLTVADFQKLQEAKEVLCNETKRKNYDHWRRSGVTIPFHDWQALNDSVKTVCFDFWIDFPKNITENAWWCIWSSVYSQCTGLWEIRRNQCWRPQMQKCLSLPKQRTFSLNKKHRGSLHMMPCHPQVSELRNVLKVMESMETQFIFMYVASKVQNAYKHVSGQ